MEVTKRICNTCAIHSDWLLFGIEPKYRNKRKLHELPEHSLSIITSEDQAEHWESLEDPRNFKGVPILSSIAAGPARMVDEKDIDGYAVIYQDWLSNGNHVCFRVKGDSMLPVLATGDLVGVNLDRRDPHELHNGIIAAYIDEGVTVKQLKFEPKDNGAYLVPINKDYSPKFVTQEKLDLVIVGLVEWSWKKM